MKTLSLTEMENIEGGASGYCWAMFAGVAVGAIGAFFNPFLGAAMIAYGVMSINSYC